MLFYLFLAVLFGYSLRYSFSNAIPAHLHVDDLDVETRRTRENTKASERSEVTRRVSAPVATTAVTITTSRLMRDARTSQISSDGGSQVEKEHEGSSSVVSAEEYSSTASTDTSATIATTTTTIKHFAEDRKHPPKHKRTLIHDSQDELRHVTVSSEYSTSEDDETPMLRTKPVLQNDTVSMQLAADTDNMATADVSRVLILYTGGTIGMKHTRDDGYRPVTNFLTQTLSGMPRFHDPRGHFRLSTKFSRHSLDELGTLMGEEPTNKVAVLDTNTSTIGTEPIRSLITPQSLYGKRIRYSVIEYEPLLDSCNISMVDWIRIATDIEANYQFYDAFIILHGTDTMAYTASALSFLLENLGKTVILTGSQVPVSEVRNDAVENLLGALTIAGHFVIPEVCLFFNNKLFRGNRTSKTNAVDFDAFDSPNLRPLVSVGINIDVNWSAVLRPSIIEKFRAHKELEPNVASLRLFPGITRSTVRAFLKPPIRGVVLETYGAGNAPDTRNDIMRLLEEASARGVVIVNCTQCKRGLVSDIYATGKALTQVGVVPGSDMTPECALAKLSYLLGKKLPPEQVRLEMMQNLRGELTIPSMRQRFTVHNYAHNLIQDIINAATDVESNDLGSDLQDRVLSEKSLYPILLCSAAGMNDLDGLHLLVGSVGGLSLNVVDYDGRTPLHIACTAGYSEIVEFLLKNGASVHVRDRFGHTPLFEAARNKHLAVITLLRKAGAHFNDFENDDIVFRALLCAAAGDVELLKHFVAAGFDVNRTGFDQRTALHHAVSETRLATVQYLLTLSEINVNLRDRWNRTALDEGEMNLGRVWERDSQRENDIRDIVRLLRTAQAMQERRMQERLVHEIVQTEQTMT